MCILFLIFYYKKKRELWQMMLTGIILFRWNLQDTVLPGDPVRSGIIT